MSKKYTLPREVSYIIDKLNENGYRADVVGGAVRDMYLGRELSDFDITTDALPEKIKEIFHGVRTIDTGLKHGTVALHINGENYEVTTYRRDGDYLDARHPASVEFTSSLSEDVARRDFTMNALCFNERDGITDLVGGIADIDRRIIRTVGDPVTRFSEDALRILRALRFSSVLTFGIEKKTAAAIHGCRGQLLGISRERIYAEWCKLISGDNAYSVIDEFSDVFSVLFPMLSLKLPDRRNFERAGALARMLSLFYLGSDEPALAFDTAMRSLKTDRATRELGVSAIHTAEKGAPADTAAVLRSFARVGVPATELGAELGLLVGSFGEDTVKLIDGAKSSGAPYRISELAVDGRDLLLLGLRGEEIGLTLSQLLNLVIDGGCENERGALLNAIATLH
ncbi:MAG: polynucleotide adenylyltransferase [Clostridia bacterium]|nr:polynucleotide adenylyltransferase [Clostridia bacterium]